MLYPHPLSGRERLAHSIRIVRAATRAAKAIEADGPNPATAFGPLMPLGDRAGALAPKAVLQRARDIELLARNHACGYGDRVIFDAFVGVDGHGVRPEGVIPVVHGDTDKVDVSGVWLLSSGVGLTSTGARALAARGPAGAAVRFEHPDPTENDARAGRKAWDRAAAAIGLWCQARIPAALVAPVGPATDGGVLSALHDLAHALGASRLVLVPASADVGGAPPFGFASNFARRRNTEPAFWDYPGVCWLGADPVHLIDALGGSIDALARAAGAMPTSPGPRPAPPPPPRADRPSGGAQAVLGTLVESLERTRGGREEP